jgi:hypothetical protein
MKSDSVTSLVLLILVVLAGGCVTRTRLPLCPKLAEKSYESAATGKNQIVGRFVKEQAARRGITITPLSYFVAEFKGPSHQVRWLRENYDTLLTAFNPKLITWDEVDFTAAHQHVRTWMELVDQKRYSELMLAQHKFCPVCCSSEYLQNLR